MVFTRKNFTFKTMKILMLGLFFVLGINTAILAGSYTVKPGDSLFLIGQRFGLTAEQLQSANGLKGPWIYSGQVLNIPGSNSYTVKQGDTLYLIAKNHGITWQQLMNHNGLQNTDIVPGQRLAMPSQNNNSANYVVKPRDTLFSIGQQFGVSYKEIQQANNTSSSNIRPGQTLIIPASSSADRRAAATSSRGVSSHSFSREDITLLARTVYSEARGEPYEGQVAVAAVVLNRLRHPNFPNTVRGVIFQPLAFTAVADGQFWLPPNQTAYKAVNDAINGWDPAKGALYYWNPVTATSRWIWSRTVTHQIGKHVFGF